LIGTENEGEEGMRTRHFLVAGGALLLVAWALNPAFAAEYFVPDDPGCDTVQNCIGQASDTDIITVKPGTYPEHIDFLGKAITVRSQDGPATTILDGTQPGFVVTFENGEVNDSVLEGFTIRNAQTLSGVLVGGILCADTSPTIQGNEITQVGASGDDDGLFSAAGIFCQNGSPVIENNRIVDNGAGGSSYLAAGSCSGILCQEGSPVIKGNVISGNMAFGYMSGSAAGISVENYSASHVIISGNTITDNEGVATNYVSGGGMGSGIIVSSGDQVTIQNNIIARNQGSSASGLGYGNGISVVCGHASVLHNTIVENDGSLSGDGLVVDVSVDGQVENNIVVNNTGLGLCTGGSGTVVSDYNDVWGNGVNYGCGTPGNNDLSEDPLFVDPSGDDYHLQEGSLCIDSGTDAGVTEDIEGDPRPQGYGFDMGAYETAGPPPPCPDNDGDEYGDPASVTCTHPELDCDDTDADVNPGATEVCDNGIDDDCDGSIDYDDPDCPSLFRFDVFTYGVGSWPWSVAIEDLDGDNAPDIAVANPESDDISVLLGNGDGTFQPSVNYDAGDWSFCLAIEDLNGDNAPDLAVTIDTNTVSILLGNGDGTFQAPIGYGAGDMPALVAVGDLNGDDVPDLAVANNESHDVSVLLGNGDGTFQTAVNHTVVSYPFSVAIGNFNGDNMPDLAVANMGDMYEPVVSDVSVLLGNGDGSFQAAVNYEAGILPTSVAIGDLNGDGREDLAVTIIGGFFPGLSRLAVFLGNGDGTFTAPLKFRTGNGPTSVAIRDLNGDGREDLAVANAGFNVPNDSSVSVFINRTGVASLWGAASTVAMKAKPASDILNYLFVLLVPIGAMMLWKQRRRTK
jgi:hypothetical protein